MLFAISVAGATGYLMVATEFRMARFSGQSDEAQVIARAGLNRFVAEQLGAVGDSVSYAMGNGIALITTRKIAEVDSLTDVYYVRSQGSVQDIRMPNSPATRVVAAYARHHRRPLAHHAAAMVNVSDLLTTGGRVRGNDANTAGDCAGGGASPITGGIARSTVSGDILGSPNSQIWTFAQMYNAVALRWDVLSDSTFPIEFDGATPNFSLLPADSFPVVRFLGNLDAGNAWDGRGVLIVTGRFNPSSSFDWNGIILAGWVDDDIDGEVRGILVGGLDGLSHYASTTIDGDYDYYSCYVYAANESLSYLELIEESVFEVN